MRDPRPSDQRTADASSSSEGQRCRRKCTISPLFSLVSLSIERKRSMMKTMSHAEEREGRGHASRDADDHAISPHFSSFLYPLSEQLNDENNFITQGVEDPSHFPFFTFLHSPFLIPCWMTYLNKMEDEQHQTLLNAQISAR